MNNLITYTSSSLIANIYNMRITKNITMKLYQMLIFKNVYHYKMIHHQVIEFRKKKSYFLFFFNNCYYKTHTINNIILKLKSL